MTGVVAPAAVIGAGPYGLSVAAHLQARGITARVFGAPMTFWRAMPASINLKSFAFATSVYTPRPGFTFPEYCRARGLEDLEPCTMACFAEYGLWAQRELVPQLEPTDVVDVRLAADGTFELRLATGESVLAGAVVVATGLSHFAWTPPVLAHLPSNLVSHSSIHTVFDAFAGKDVAVIGGGASAVETATILLESGARPLLLVRETELVFHDKFDPNRGWRERLRFPNSVLGPGRKSWVLEHFPLLLHHVPERRRVRFTRNYLGPAGPWWLRERFHGKVTYRLGASVVQARPAHGGSRVELEILERGGSGEDTRTSTQTFDHVIAGTGFEVDVDALPFLDAPLRQRVRRVDRAPALSSHFESSVQGLYFVGPSAALSFGPLFRFVTGAEIAAPRVARHLTRYLARARAGSGPVTRMGGRRVEGVEKTP